jgi:hypothetical protein
MDSKTRLIEIHDSEMAQNDCIWRTNPICCISLIVIRTPSPQASFIQKFTGQIPPIRNQIMQNRWSRLGADSRSVSIHFEIIAAPPSVFLCWIK